MKLISALLSETKSGIFSDKTYIDSERQAIQFERAYQKLAKLVYPDLKIVKGYDPELRMNLTLAYEDPADIHYRYIESSGEFFYDKAIFDKILSSQEVFKLVGRHINPDPVITFMVYGGSMLKLNP